MAYTPNSLSSRFLSRTYIDDPSDATVVRTIAWVPIGVAGLFKATLVSGTGVLTFRVMVATDSAGTGSTVVATHGDPTTADAAGDQLVLEVTAEQCLAALARASHWTVEMDCDTNSDICAVEYLVDPFLRTSGLTADVIA